MRASQETTSENSYELEDSTGPIESQWNLWKNLDRDPECCNPVDNQLNSFEFVTCHQCSVFKMTLEPELSDSFWSNLYPGLDPKFEFTNHEVFMAGQENCFISHRCVPIQLVSDTGRRVKINALLDDGSNMTLLSERTANELGLTGDPLEMSYRTVSGESFEVNSSSVEFYIESLDGSYKKWISANTFPSPADKTIAINWNDYKENWPHLKDINFPEMTNDQVDMLIGNNFPCLSRSLEEVSGVGDMDPIARRTPLGWTAVGPVEPVVKKEKRALIPKVTTLMLTARM